MGFAGEWTNRVSGFWRRFASLGLFVVELLVYIGLISAYLFVVIHFLGDWIIHLFNNNRSLYAIVALLLITVQGIVLERLTSALIWVIRYMLR